MADFSHFIFAGATGTGKTTVAVALAKKIREKKQIVIVHTSADARRWPVGAKIARDADELEALLKAYYNWGGFVFLDEALDLYEEADKKKHKLVYSLHRNGRHKGYTAYYIVQNLTELSPSIRRNAKILYCFNMGADKYIARMVQNNFPNIRVKPNEPLADSVLNLNDYEFLRLENGKSAKICRL